MDNTRKAPSPAPETEGSPYVIEMRGITKVFPGIVANDNITLQLKRGEIHALLGENGAGKSTLMSVLFGLYQPEQGEIYKDGKKVVINNPNDANALGIGMVHQHFKLVDVFSVLDNIILGIEPASLGFLRKKEARQKVLDLSKNYGLNVDPDALVEDITVGMQQRTEILKMLYRENEILIFDEPTAVLTPQEITELMNIMKGLAAEGKSILFISHKLNEIMEVADRCTVLRKGKYVGTVNVSDVTKEDLSAMMVGRDVKFAVDKEDAKPAETILDVKNLTVKSKLHRKNAVSDVSLQVRVGEIVCIAGIDGNGQSEFVAALTGLQKAEPGAQILLCGEDVTKKTIRYKNTHGISHIPEDRHKHGLVLDYTLQENIVLQRYFEVEFQKYGFIRFDKVRAYADSLIERFDIRSGQGADTIARSMSGGNQQKAIIAREMDRAHKLLVAVQPTRGLDVGAIEFIHEQIVATRDAGSAVLLISLELDEVMNLSDRILVMYEGEITGEFDPKTTSVEELGLYMAGAKRQNGQKGGENHA
ncbi:MAG: ABC transporter ATP-binding protein [Clostridia bacterium]|nr:ABC transporter ATP-binding protein [Clostridia bacterium]